MEKADDHGEHGDTRGPARKFNELQRFSCLVLCLALPVSPVFPVVELRF